MTAAIVSGTRFTRLVAVEPGTPYRRKDGGRKGGKRWVCQCDCGVEKLVAERHLLTGAIKSCGCLQRKYALVSPGARFERLVVVELGAPYPDGRRRWTCLCDCGQTKLVMENHLNRGKILSCGCLAKEKNTTHGATARDSEDEELRRIHKVWISMRQRCTNPRNQKYADYGGRGIKVCERWDDFASFIADMGMPPPGKPTIDRIDNWGGYEPGNCRWTTRTVQQRNRRDNRWVMVDGEELSFRDACDKLGQDPFLAQARINRGWSIERAVFTPRPANAKPRRERQHGPGAPVGHWQWCGPPRCEACRKCHFEWRAARKVARLAAVVPDPGLR